MSSFTAPLTLTYAPQDNLWIVDRELTYYVGKEGSEDKITVPNGFLTDLASIPPIAEMLIPRSGRYNSASVVHDYLYRIMGNITPPYNMKYRTKKDADKIFLEAMGVLGVAWFKRKLMYRAVRLNLTKKWTKYV